MSVVTLDAMTPPAVDALTHGQVVVLPGAVLDAIDSGRDGQLRELERHFAQGRPGPQPIALSIPCLHLVVVWPARAYYEQRPTGPDISRVIMRVVAGGADSEAGEQFNAALRDVSNGAPVQVLDVDGLVAAGALA